MPQAQRAEKLEELILYIAERMERDEHLGRGRMKLAKLLYVIDFEAYARWGRSVSGTTYHAEQHGPAPTGEMMATRDLEGSGRFEWRREWDKQELPVANDAPRLEVFEPKEIALAEKVLAENRTRSAREMIDRAHEDAGWVHAWDSGRGKGRKVPFESIFWNSKRTQAKPWEREQARALAERHGLDPEGSAQEDA